MPTPKRRCWISCTRQGLGVRGVELDPHSRGGLCGRSLGLPCARNNNPFAGQSQAHEQFVVPLWKHVCERAENTRDTEREREKKGTTTTTKRPKNSKGNTKARGGEVTSQQSRYSEKDWNSWRSHARAERKSDHKPPMPLVAWMKGLEC